MNLKLFSLCLVVVCGLSVWQVAVIPDSPMYAVVGATLIPGVVAALLCCCTSLYVVSVIKKSAVDITDDEDQAPLPLAQWRTLYFFLGAIVFIFTIKWLGFALAGTLAGMGIARAFDERLGFKSFLVCAASSGFFWVLFDRLLSVDLGPLFPFLAT